MAEFMAVVAFASIVALSITFARLMNELLRL